MATSCRLSHEALLRLEELKPHVARIFPCAAKSNEVTILALMDFFESRMVLAVIGEQRRYYEDAESARHAVQKRYPEATFTAWQENNEPEATEGEEVMYVLIDGEPIAAIYQNRLPALS